MKKLLLLFSLLSLLTEARAQYSTLYVSHPQKSLSGYGTIESAIFVVRPKGAFAQCDLYMTLSARGLGFSPADSFEVQFYMSLPSNATVTDLWLWVGNDIMRASLLDRWTASSIYNGIVKRRRDPCLLTREYSNNDWTQYTARIYPLMGTGQRKIKLSYCVPMQWNTAGASVPLPFHLLKVGTNTPVARVRAFPDSSWGTPKVLDQPNTPFTLAQDSLTGPVYQMDLSTAQVAGMSGLTLSYGRTLDRGYFLSRHSAGGTNYYQLVANPAVLLNKLTPRHVVALVDVDTVTVNNYYKSSSYYYYRPPTFYPADLFNGLRSFFLRNLSARDSFAVVYRGLTGLQKVGGGWFAGDQQGIDNAFAAVGQMETIGRGGSLPALLDAGLQLARTGGGDASIVLISGSIEYGDYAQANGLLAQLSLTRDIPVNVVDIAYPYYEWFSSDGQYSYNSQYLNQNLAQLTNGLSVIRPSGSGSWFLGDLLAAVAPYLQRNPDASEVTLQPAGGFTYLRSDQKTALNGQVAWTRSFVQTGKYVGSWPFAMTVSAIYKGQVLSRTLSIDSTAAACTDSTLRQRWAGDYLAQLEAAPRTNATVSQMLALSLAERVLSTTTAFLALEPNDTLKACRSCVDESGPTMSVTKQKEPATSDSLVQAYPNPFNLSTTIRVRLPHGVRPEQARVRIFNTLGQAVRTFDPSSLSDAEAHALLWDGRNDHGATVSSGVYFFTLSSPRGTVATRLLLTK